MSSHPDKVAEQDRAAADIKFKAVSQAYEILQDDETRHMYDAHGMAAFDKSQGAGMGAGVDLDDIINMFSMGGGAPPGFGGARPRRPQKGRDEEQKYDVTLEELYKGKSTRFASTKNVICGHCKGKGGKENAKPKQCDSCGGKGTVLCLMSSNDKMLTPIKRYKNRSETDWAWICHSRKSCLRYLQRYG